MYIKIIENNGEYIHLFHGSYDGIKMMYAKDVYGG